jgi:hypothetical protein
MVRRSLHGVNAHFAPRSGQFASRVLTQRFVKQLEKRAPFSYNATISPDLRHPGKGYACGGKKT